MERKGRSFDEISSAEVAEALCGLVALVDAELPRSYYRTEMWPCIAAGFMARMAEIASSVAVLVEADCPSDASILGRVMYEQMVNFCWIAVEPTKRVERWKDSYMAHQKATHVNAARYGLRILTAGQLAEAKGKTKLSVEQMAREADEYWSPRLPGFRVAKTKRTQIDILTIDGLYLGIYRVASRLVHSTVQSLDGVMRRDKNKTVVERNAAKHVNYPPTIVPLFVLAMTVHHQLFSWPDIEKARQINDRLLF